MRKSTAVATGVSALGLGLYAIAARHEAGPERRDWFQNRIRQMFMPLLDRSGVDIVDLGAFQGQGLADQDEPSILLSKHQRATDIFTTFHAAFTLKPNGVAQIVAKHQIRRWPIVSTYINGSVVYLNRQPDPDASTLERHAGYLDTYRRLSRAAVELGERAIIGMNPEGTYVPSHVATFKLLGAAMMPALLAREQGGAANVRFVGISRNTFGRYVLGSILGDSVGKRTQVTISEPMEVTEEVIDWYETLDPTSGNQYGVKNPKIVDLVSDMQDQLLRVQNMSQQRAGLPKMTIAEGTGSGRRNRRSNRA